MRPAIITIRVFISILVLACLSPGLAKATGTSSSVSVTGDAPHGALLFGARCSMCHSFDDNKFGPLMHGVYGRKAGMIEDYDYSPALRGSNFVWNEATLDRWLANPVLMVPGTKMKTRVLAAKDRADIIAYLKDVALPSDKK